MSTSASSNFRPHPLLRSGHLQTIFGSFRRAPKLASPTIQHLVTLADGDRIVLHENCPADWLPSDPTSVLVHGLCGCHAATYIVRLARELNQRRTRTFRLDMRGCGAARDLCQQILHAGRSDDLRTATEFVAQLAPESPILMAGVSLGGNQLLKMLGEIVTDPTATVLRQRIARSVAVSPPVDLIGCSMNLARRTLRPYGNYFMRKLLKRTPPLIHQHPAWPRLQLYPRPKTMREFDNRITAPLAGFSSAEDYYAKASAAPWLAKIDSPVLVLAAKDDPIVPEFVIRAADWSSTTSIEFTDRGGHLGFVGGSNQANWLEERLATWLADFDKTVHQQSFLATPNARIA